MQRGLAAGDTEGAAQAVPQSVVDAFVIYGDPATCRRQLADYRCAGIDLPVVFPMPVAGSWDGVPEATIAAFASASSEPGELVAPGGGGGERRAEVG
ncbi:hypothetical protein PA7_44650 [Pseudonocardia asaccharolytica DSM 44247 = NBRC 16224]|uniref:Luciferase-like domain-containing protein n=2 Tax=Pseudonocardia asaccharolytica TaxID=54010 RepID=A0A511DCE6_9PSEU|nr:hypothetical protein PA7_44650 [Pseudonocardia asaccharolytica DSM 44247 = NBRC 16224]